MENSNLEQRKSYAIELLQSMTEIQLEKAVEIFMEDYTKYMNRKHSVYNR